METDVNDKTKTSSQKGLNSSNIVNLRQLSLAVQAFAGRYFKGIKQSLAKILFVIPFYF